MGGVGQVGYGPLWRIDGPPPKAPPHTLVSSSRVVDDVDAAQIERWMNGAQVYSYPPDVGYVWDACAPGSDSPSKVAGGLIPLPEFGAMTIYVAETCSSFGIWGQNLSNDEAQARFVARAQAVFGAIESWVIEAEFMGGAVLPNNPHLADGNGSINATASNVLLGFARLENEIAATGRVGTIHCSPAAATIARSHYLVPTPDSGKPSDTLYTVNGTTVIPGYGYVGQSRPAGGHAAPSAVQEYMYATGPVDIRRSSMFVLPEQVFQALDRSNNTITYRAERYYLVDWDTVLQSAVLVDWTT